MAINHYLFANQRKNCHRVAEIEDDREEPMGKAARSHSWLYEINFGEANLSIDLLSIAAPPNAYHHISSGEDEDGVEQMMNGGWCMSREGQMHHNVVAMQIQFHLPTTSCSYEECGVLGRIESNLNLISSHPPPQQYSSRSCAILNLFSEIVLM